MIIAITGPDGAGKTTICKYLVEKFQKRFGEGTALQVSVWDAVLASGLFDSKQSIVKYLSDLDGYTRTLFIYHGLSRAIDLAKRKSPRLIFVEGHWFKYAVTEIGYGVDPEVVVAASLGIPRPDLTFYLEIDPETALSRKQDQVSHYETGKQDFIRFQKNLKLIWENLEKKMNAGVTEKRKTSEFLPESKPWIHVSTQKTSEVLSDQIYSQILERL